MERAIAVVAAVVVVAAAAPAATAEGGAVGAWNEDADRAWNDARTVVADILPVLVQVVGEILAEAVRAPADALTNWNLGTQTGEGLRSDVNTTRDTVLGQTLTLGDQARHDATDWGVGTATGSGLRHDVNQTWAAAASAVREPGSDDGAALVSGLSGDAAGLADAAGNQVHHEPVHEGDRLRWENPRHDKQLREGCGGTVVYTTSPEMYYVCANVGDTNRVGLWNEDNGCQGLQTVHEDITGCGFVDPDADCATDPLACSLILGRDAGAPARALP